MTPASDRSIGPSSAPSRVVIVHGFGADRDAHWFPSLSRELESRGLDVVIVDLPAPDAPDSFSWIAAVRTAVPRPDSATWIVTHSLGGITALRALQATQENWMLGGIILVSGFTGELSSLPVLDAFLREDLAVSELIPRIGVRHVIRSDDDPYVPIEASDDLARRLHATTHVVPGAGHFLAEDGITELPLILDLVLGEVTAAASR